MPYGWKVQKKENPNSKSFRSQSKNTSSPSQEKDLLVRAQILEVARKTVLKKGYEALSIRTLMAEIDYSPMVFYRYFTNKRSLLHHLWVDIFEALIHSVEKHLDLKKPESGSRIKKIVTGNIEFWLKHPDKYKIVYLHPDYIEEGEEDRFFVDSPLIQSYLERLIQVVAWEKQARRIGKDLSEMDILRSMVVLVQGVCHSLVTVGEFPWGSHKKLYQTMVNIWYKGLQ